MGIKQFELMHGAVLLKICRNDKPLALTLIESDNSRSAYRLNDEVILYVKHSSNPGERKNGKIVWQFTFAKKHVEDIFDLDQSKPVYLALVCTHEHLDGEMEIAFLHPEQIRQCLDSNKSKAQSIFVRREPGKSLRVWGSGEELVVPRNQLDTWDVPGR